MSQKYDRVPLMKESYVDFHDSPQVALNDTGEDVHDRFLNKQRRKKKLKCFWLVGTLIVLAIVAVSFFYYFNGRHKGPQFNGDQLPIPALHRPPGHTGDTPDDKPAIHRPPGYTGDTPDDKPALHKPPGHRGDTSDGKVMSLGNGADNMDDDSDYDSGMDEEYYNEDSDEDNNEEGNNNNDDVDEDSDEYEDYSSGDDLYNYIYGNSTDYYGYDSNDDNSDDDTSYEYSDEYEYEATTGRVDVNYDGNSNTNYYNNGENNVQPDSNKYNADQYNADQYINKDDDNYMSWFYDDETTTAIPGYNSMDTDGKNNVQPDSEESNQYNVDQYVDKVYDSDYTNGDDDDMRWLYDDDETTTAIPSNSMDTDNFGVFKDVNKADNNKDYTNEDASDLDYYYKGIDDTTTTTSHHLIDNSGLVPGGVTDRPFNTNQYIIFQSRCKDCLASYNTNLPSDTGDRLVQAMLHLLNDSAIKSKCRAYCEDFLMMYREKRERTSKHTQ